MRTPPGCYAAERFVYKKQILAILKASPESWTPLQPYELEWLIEEHHKRWDVISLELGASLHAMRQFRHWPTEDTNHV
jgi:hypothetical protein